jgi:co-chaperonin GroES (HSP10)
VPIVAIHHEKDPREAIVEQAGDLSDIEVFNNQVLVGVYIRPEKTKSGLILTHKTTDEDKYQSKTGVILKMGPTAFEDPRDIWFRDASFEEGDWVVYRASDGWTVTLVSQDPKTGEKRELLCRLMDDTSIRMRAQTPDRVY